ncbi:MAG: PHP domain-containing protein [Sporomusaceae bacterium]|nr:PHP domain-containing protein [Sporomusaceae bacterium]
MKFIADLHVHTISSGHAYSTVLEIAQAASKKEGLEMIALTDHGPSMPGAPCAYHFSNQVAIPNRVHGVRILKGIEANIMNRDGGLDLDDDRLAKLDVVAAGLHTFCAPYGSMDENTMMLINAMKNRFVDIIVHPGNPEYLMDEAIIVQAAAELDVALEINNCSLTAARKGSEPHCHNIVNLAKLYGTKLVVGSDSHFADTVADFGAAQEILSTHGIPAEQVLNTSVERILDHLNRRSNRTHKVVF